MPGTGNTATFNAASPNTGINLGAGVLINTLLFNTASAAAYTLGTGAVGSQTLTLNDSGAITVNSTVSTSQLVNANVVLELNATPAAYSFTNNSATNGQLLTIAGGVSSGLGSSPPSALKTLTLGGSANGLLPLAPMRSTSAAFSRQVAASARAISPSISPAPPAASRWPVVRDSNINWEPPA